MVGIIHRTRSNSTYYFLVRFLFEFPLVADGPVNAYGVETGVWPTLPGIPLVVGDPISGYLTAFAFRLRRRQQPVFGGHPVNNSLDID
jgi:hypothetical protein